MRRARKLKLVPPAPTPSGYAAKLAAAKEYLGTRWCHHPQFVGKSNLRVGLLNQWRAQRHLLRGPIAITTKVKP